MTELHDPNDKSAWCELGELAERQFLARIWDSGLTIMRNPAKAADRFAHDVFAVLPADLKTVRTTFRTAWQYGIDPRFAVTLNEKDVQRYRKYPVFVVIFDVNFAGVYAGIHYAWIDRIVAAIDTGRAQFHTYLTRENDRIGNAKGSWVMDVRWFRRVDELAEGKAYA